MSGIERIQNAFNTAKNQGRAAFMPYLPVGYPDLPISLDLFQALAKAGADLIEVGVPFSDPLVDGPTIQAGTPGAGRQAQHRIPLPRQRHRHHRRA
jgi:tryptophan synthase alpha chain